MTSQPLRVNKVVLAMMFVGLATMFAWSFVYRAANPSLVARLDTHGSAGQSGPAGQADPSGPMGAMGGPVMKAVIDAMARLKQNPDDLEALRQGAEAFASAEMWERAGQLTDKALAKTPDDPEMNNLHGVVLFKMDHAAEAAKVFEHILGLDPDNFQAQYNLGVVYKEGLKDQAKAKVFFDAVIANPKADAETKDQARQEMAPGS
jgi:tetratricopeptide (TPR) repeat protein